MAMTLRGALAIYFYIGLAALLFVTVAYFVAPCYYVFPGTVPREAGLGYVFFLRRMRLFTTGVDMSTTYRNMYMDTKTVETIKQQLLKHRQSVQQELKDVAGRVPDASGESQASFPDYGSDDDENSAEVETFTTNLSLEKVLASSLRDIDSALERIEKGTYGACKYCGKPIDERRLIARPASSSVGMVVPR